MKSNQSETPTARADDPLSLAKDGGAIAFLFAIAAIYFLPILVYGNKRVLSSIDGDTWSQFFYWRRFAFDSLARGEIPLWNPYNFSGQPFIGAMQSAIFYPPNLIFLVFDTPFAVNLNIAIHCLGASVFTFLFARYVGVSSLGAILSGVTFAYGAPYFLHIYPGHLPHLSAMWMPLMFLAMEAFLRHGKLRYALWAGVSLALEVLAGYPQYSFYCALAVSLYFIIHLAFIKELSFLPRYVAGYALFGGAAVLLAAVQLVPAWELVKNSARGTVSFEWISIFSLPPENLLTLILPDVFGDIVNVPYWGKNNLWEMSVYVGIVPLAMIVLGIVMNWSRPVVVFTVIGGGFLLLALGKHTPFLWFLYSLVPGFTFFRGVGKAAFVFAFCAALLAGFGLETLRQWFKNTDKRLFGLALFLVITFVFIGIIALVSPAGDPHAWSAAVRAYASAEEHFEQLPLDVNFFQSTRQMFWGDVAKLAVLLLALAGICFISVKAWCRSPGALVIAVLILAVVDLWHFGARFAVSFDPRILFMDTDLKTFLKSDSEIYRIATPLARLRNHLLNVGMIEGIENVGGYDAIVVRGYNEFINLTQGLPLDHPNLLMGINRISPLLNLLNVKYYLVEPSIKIDLPDFDIAFENTKNKVYRSQKTQSRSFLVHDVRVAASSEETLRQLLEPGLDPSATVILDETVPGLAPNAQARSPTPRIVEHSPKRVVIAAETSVPGMLVLGDSYYPGWRAFVAGTEVKIYRANHVMRAVFLPAGRHRVVFRYEPFSFKLGVVMTGATVVVILGFLLGDRVWGGGNTGSPDNRHSKRSEVARPTKT
jgi:hypothetical protein